MKYSLRLTSGRVVTPGSGGFYWYYRDGSGAGGVHDFNNLVHALASKKYGGVGVSTEFGVGTSVIEFIPVAQLESVIRHPAEPKTEGPYR